jgi:hypothetical protein
VQADCLVSGGVSPGAGAQVSGGREDGFAALTWVGHHAVEIGGDPERIAIGGDSGGGNLAAVCVILARDAGFPKLAFQLLVYPRTAAWEDSASHHEFSEGYLLTRETILWFHNHCLNSDEDRKDWRWAPLDCPDLSRLPPALVIVGEYDPLRDEGIAYAERMRREGNTVGLTNYAGMAPLLPMGGAIDAGAIAQATRALASFPERLMLTKLAGVVATSDRAPSHGEAHRRHSLRPAEPLGILEVLADYQTSPSSIDAGLGDTPSVRRAGNADRAAVLHSGIPSSAGRVGTATIAVRCHRELTPITPSRPPGLVLSSERCSANRFDRG